MANSKSIMITCRCCGVEFVGAPQQLYCSDQCRKIKRKEATAAYRERMKTPGYKPQTYKDIEKKIFGRLTAKRIVGKEKGGAMIWECECECGNTVNVSIRMLQSGNTKSCGCLNKSEEASARKSASNAKYNCIRA